MLGLISKTKQGCELLKQQGWDAVRHSRRQPWPVVPDEVEQQYQQQQYQQHLQEQQQQQHTTPGGLPASLLSTVPSTLSLNSESTSSRHNSESDSTQPSESESSEPPFTHTHTMGQGPQNKVLREPTGECGRFRGFLVECNSNQLML